MRCRIAGVVGVMLLAGCGGGGGAASHPVAVGDEPLLFWDGSVNGDAVADATNDFFFFHAADGSLVFGDTVYPNTWVTESGELIWDGESIGGVDLVWSEYGEPMAALVDHEGYLIDFFGPEHDLHWEHTDLPADLAWGAGGGGAHRAGSGDRATLAGAGPPNVVEGSASGSAGVTLPTPSPSTRGN